MLGGCATQACAVTDDDAIDSDDSDEEDEGKTPLQWAEENKAPEEVLSLLRAASAKPMGDDNAQSLCASLAAHALTALDLSRNKLTAVPPAVCDIVGLQTLDLSGNAIAELPPGLLRLTELRDGKKVEWDESKHGEGTEVVGKSDGRSGVVTEVAPNTIYIRIKFDDDGSV
eukprot:COSAG04_NODE_12310_length_659_cov_0.501786_1_plen_170_part_10